MMLKMKRISVFLSILCFMVFLVPVPDAQAQYTVEKRSQIGGWTDDACVFGDYAYVIKAEQVAVLDVSGNTIHKVNSLFLDNEPAAVFAVDPLLLVFMTRSDSGLVIYSLEDPENPVYVGRFAIPTGAFVDFRQNGAVFYLVTGEYFHVLDLSNPFSPAILKTLPIEDGRCVEASGGCVYVGTGNALLIFEGNTDPVYRKSLTMNTVRDLATYSDHLYIATEQQADKELITMQVYDPLNPVQTDLLEPKHTEGFVTWIKNPYRLQVANQTLYLSCSGGDPGILMYSLADFAHPAPVGYFGMPEAEWGSARSLNVVDHMAYMAVGHFRTLVKVDVTNPAAPVLVDTYIDVNSLMRVAATEERVYAVEDDALLIYDITSPDTPALLGFDTRLGSLFRLVPEGNRLTAVRNDTLFVIDVTNPAGLVIQGRLALGYNRARQLTVRGSRAFAMVEQFGIGGYFEIADIQDPAHPQSLKSLPLPGQDRALYVTEDGATAYAGYDAEGVYGVQILDVSDPANAAVTGTIATQCKSTAMCMNGSRLYIGGQSDDTHWILETWDVSDPASPVPGPSRTGSGIFVQMNVYDDMLLVSTNGDMDALAKDAPVQFRLDRDGNPHLVMDDGRPGLEKTAGPVGGGLRFLDLNDLAQFFFIDLNTATAFELFFLAYMIVLLILWSGWFDPNGYDHYVSMGIALFGLIAGGSFIQDRLVQPAMHEIVQNYPNPFNPETNIEFTVAQPCHVTLNVYDLRGRLVRTLVDEQRPAGTYNARFEARDLPSGIYTYQIQAGEILESKKMILLR
ncbi:T9SS type A sorting domain-containing protein [bacterium]|nr:T9SS type A sorting domain-containing protein [bacterium]